MNFVGREGMRRPKLSRTPIWSSITAVGRTFCTSTHYKLHKLNFDFSMKFDLIFISQRQTPLLPHLPLPYADNLTYCIYFHTFMLFNFSTSHPEKFSICHSENCVVCVVLLLFHKSCNSCFDIFRFKCHCSQNLWREESTTCISSTLKHRNHFKWLRCKSRKKYVEIENQASGNKFPVCTIICRKKRHAFHSKSTWRK